MISNILRSVYRKWQRRKQKLHLLNIDRPVYIAPSAFFSFHKNISIGQYCRIGNKCHIDGEGGVTIGDGTIFAPNVVILSSSHDYKNNDFLPYGFGDVKMAVVIGKGCWIGWGALIRPGVSIGNGAVVAMGTVVTKDVPPGTLVGGNPGQIIKSIRSQDEIFRLINGNKFFLKEVIETKKKREGRGKGQSNELFS